MAVVIRALVVAVQLFAFYGSSFAQSNACRSSPCENGGTCVPFDIGIIPEGFACNCASGFSGSTCSITLCPPINPCRNNGVCVPQFRGQWTCDCSRTGFTGRLCQTPDNSAPNPCDSNPCQNGGSCMKSAVADAFTCLCPTSHRGLRCQLSNTPVPSDPCSSSPCVNNGTCLREGGSAFRCVCSGEYSGVLCEISPTPCASSPCQNGGNCVDLFNRFVCFCKSGYSGATCTTRTTGGPSTPTTAAPPTRQPQQVTTDRIISGGCTGKLAPLRCYVRFVSEMYMFVGSGQTLIQQDSGEYCGTYSKAQQCIDHFNSQCNVLTSRTQYYIRIARENLAAFSNGLVAANCLTNSIGR